MKKMFIICTMFILTLSVFAFAEEDPFDLSQFQNDVEGFNEISKDEVQNISEEALKLFEDGDYENAEIQLKLWAESANYLANVISSGLEPYYSASYDDRDDFPYSKIEKIVPYESLANKLKEERNHAMVMRAESLVKLGNEEKAISVYRKALDLISIDDWDWWIRAVNGLYEIINIDLIDVDK